MLVLLSPAKKLNFETPCPESTQTKPLFLSKTNKLAKELKKLNSNDIGKMMKLSLKLSDLNYQRFQSFKPSYNPDTSKQAMFAFNGDTYTGLDVESFSKTDIKTAQKRVRILSGLYGILNPLDLIQPYRLEMGTRFKFQEYKNLYQYWKEDVTNQLNQELKAGDYIINCASTEYFSVVDRDSLNATIITPEFRELRDGVYKMISFNAKRARGMMAKFVVQNKLTKPEQILDFNLDNYTYNPELSTKYGPVFTR
jgi:cytoplasmic iron level regulating protein YaaA (DUF328/UPF0246 family)